MDIVELYKQAKPLADALLEAGKQEESFAVLGIIENQEDAPPSEWVPKLEKCIDNLIKNELNELYGQQLLNTYAALQILNSKRDKSGYMLFFVIGGLMGVVACFWIKNV